ncbi:hypothetical protein BDM02DRAFT_2058473 [Thelephora ganbajun]|uniref:Uncharacterized protein n=1 Tax=Thelephora ganbajun TaxID=370292 RepID=A0ACB6ZGW7_THEGA|nr:hypothetical protein BDM02DRAFT_2058473 [Thelephora ganbajun]
MLLQDITNTHRHNPVPTMLKRRSTKKKTVRARKPRTTVHSLPNEVLMEVFIAATFASDESRLDVPDILSHVSSRWRAIIFNTSLFWTFIVVTFPFAANQIARAKAALVRSKNRPIDVHIDVRDPEWTWESDEDQHAVRSFDMVEIMEWLGPSHPRWRSLSVFTDNWEPMQTFLAYSTMFSALPALEMLSLNRCNAYAGLPGTTPDSVAPTELFGGNACLPKLRHVILSGVHIDYSCSGFKDLISLDLRHQSHGVSPSLQELRQILSASPELNSLSLVALSPSCSYGLEELDAAPITMSHLKKLTLGWWNVEDAIELLEEIRTLTVEELSLEDLGSSLLGSLGHSAFDDFPTHDSTQILGVFMGMSEAHRNPASPSPSPSPSSIASDSLSPCRPEEEASGFPSCLRTLAINGVHLDPVTFSEFLPRLIHLEELELKSVDNGLISALSTGIQPPSVDQYPTTSNPVLGPTLRTLKLWLSNGGFREAARALYEIKLRHPDVRIVNMVKLVLPGMAPNGTA